MLNEEVSSQSARKEFLVLIRRKILVQKNCYLLSDLVEELQQLYEMYCTTKSIRDNKNKKNVKEFICFKPAGGINGNPTVVRTHEMNPVDCGIASIIRAGLHDEEITVSFTKMIHHKMKAQQTGTSFPFSAESYFEELDKNNPIKEIFNAVSLSHDPLVPKNKFGYAAPKSSVKANKIWYEC